MKKYLFDKKMSKKIKEISLASVLAMSSLFTGCSGNKTTETTESVESITSTLESENNVESTNSDIESTTVGSANLYEKETELVDTTKSKIKTIFKDMNEDVILNSAIIIDLDELAKEDENGKVNADVISNFKNKIDSNNMMSDFNTLVDALENYMITENKIITTSDIVVNADDKKILSNIENITKNIIDGKDINENFDKLYKLFVEEDSITIDEFEFEIRDLSFSSRVIASTYARVGAYYSRNNIKEEEYSKMDRRTNDQNSKAYIMTKLEILNNLMDEKSIIDVNTVFNNKYESASNLLNEKVKLSSGDSKDLINYINLEYLNSDLVATKDKREILGGYDDSKMTDTMLAIDSINEYNFKNQDKIIVFSDFLIDEYAKTSTGTIDEISMNFVEYNSLMARKTITDDADFSQVFNNPYFQNIYKYILKQDTVYKYEDENGKNKEYTIIYQEVSDSVQLINNETIKYTLSKLPDVKYMEDYIKQSESNVEESIQHIQNVVTGECEKVDFEDLSETEENPKVKEK